MGAALAYYTALSLAPLLLIFIAIAGALYGETHAAEAVLSQFEKLIGAEGAGALKAMMENAKHSDSSVWSLVIGAGVLLVGTTTVFAELQGDLDRIWKVKPVASNGLWSFVRTRLLSFGLVISVGFLLLVSLLATAVIAAIGEYWGYWLEGKEWLASVLNTGVSLGIITLLFALIFKLLPSTTVAWSDVWMGAAVTSILFSVGKYAIGLYLGTVALSSSFGAAGAFVVLMVWIYYAAQVFLLGAEFTFQYATAHGSHSGLDGDLTKSVDRNNQLPVGNSFEANARSIPAHK